MIQGQSNTYHELYIAYLLTSRILISKDARKYCDWQPPKLEAHDCPYPSPQLQNLNLATP